MTLELVETAETETPVQPLCAACGRHPVERVGQLCNEPDRDEDGQVIKDGDTWHCASKAAYFAARFRHTWITWDQGEMR